MYMISLDITEWDDGSIALLRQAVAMRRGKTLDPKEATELLAVAQALSTWEPSKSVGK